MTDSGESDTKPQGFLLDPELARIARSWTEGHLERKPEAIVAEGVLNLARRVERLEASVRAAFDAISP